MSRRSHGIVRGVGASMGRDSRRSAPFAAALLCVGLIAGPPLHRVDACDAMLSAEYREPPEWLEFDLDPAEWEVAFRTRSALHAAKEFVPPGETPRDWTRFITWNANFGPERWSIEVGESRVLDPLRALCPDVAIRSVRDEAGDRIFSWQHDGCVERPPQQEIVRLVVGTLAVHQVTFSRRGELLGEEDLERWVEWISELEIGERIPFDSPELSAYDRAQVAVWKGHYDEAAEPLRELAEAGDPRAQDLYARLHVEGWGVPRDYERARSWFQKAVETLPEAAYNLGRLYEAGSDQPSDPESAYRWYRSAAERGLADAQSRVGFMLAEGIGAETDRVEAYRWFERAAAQGHEHARFWLAKLTAEGAVADPDPERARSLYEELARGGEFEAQYQLGVLCASGEVESCGDPEAKHWLMRSILQNNDEAREFYLDRYSRSEGSSSE